MIRLGLLGFGNVGQALAHLLLSHPKGRKFAVTGIVTGRHGTLVRPEGIELCGVLSRMGQGDGIGSDETTAMKLAADGPCDVVIELSPLNVRDGEPAASHVRAALRAGRHVVTANKGPIAFYHRELSELARQCGRRLLFESTVMDGTPVFNMARGALRGCKVNGFRGILNTTTNFLLDAMMSGQSYSSALAEAQRRGFAEADPSLDVDGWDAAVKTAVLLNVLMEGAVTPADVTRESMAGIGEDQLNDIRARGRVLKPVCEGGRTGDGVWGRLSLCELPAEDPFAQVRGTSSILTLHTDLMGSITVTEHDPELPQTAYGVFTDLLTILEEEY